MTPKEYSKRLLKFANKLDASKPFFDAVANNVNERSERVFVRGDFNAKDYSNNPLYVNPKSAPRSFPTKGKTGKTTFANGKKHKTGYFSSYKQFKTTIGQPAFVNLVLFGNLQRAFRTGLRASKLKINHVIKIDAANPKGKVEGLIKKYPHAFDLTAKERKEFNEDLTNYINDLIEKI
jgi:hypothetical protein